MSLVKRSVRIVGKYFSIAVLSIIISSIHQSVLHNTHASQEETTASSTSNANTSVLAFPARSFWKMPRIGSTCPFATISVAARGMSDDNSRARAGTFPLDSHKPGERTGATKAW